MYFHLKIATFLLLLCSSCKKAEIQTTDQAIFGAGCFWVLDYYFEEIKGVTSSNCIYTNSGSEAVLITYDPNSVSFEELCDVFFELHDPSTDYKDQYISLIHVNSKTHRDIAYQKIAALKEEIEVKTTVQEAGLFKIAEEMHQDWHKKKNSIPKCSIPKDGVLESILRDY